MRDPEALGWGRKEGLSLGMGHGSFRVFSDTPTVAVAAVDKPAGPVWSGLVWSDLVKSGQVGSGLVRSGQAWSSLV